jgi:hypothetical protein
MAIEFDYISKKIKVVELRIRFPYTEPLCTFKKCTPQPGRPVVSWWTNGGTSGGEVLIRKSTGYIYHLWLDPFEITTGWN